MELKHFLQENTIPFDENVSLSNKTWIKTGGVCSYWIMPVSVCQLKTICTYLYSNSIKFDLVGQTSNLFFHAAYNPQVIVSTVKINNYEIKDGYIFSDCGVSVIKLAKDCMSQGYAGFYGLIGLPGTIASSVFNNAGCFNCSISSMLVSADVLLPDGTVQILHKDDFLYSHRSSVFKRGERKGIILSVKLKVEKADNVEEEYKKAEETKVYRKTRQEMASRNLGSVFGHLEYKHTFKNRFVDLVSKAVGVLGIYNYRAMRKKLLLLLSGYYDLNQYVSDKNLNIFIWNDAMSEAKFERYKKFMGEVYKNLEQEIEERV